jgi:hypothetical protein
MKAINASNGMLTVTGWTIQPLKKSPSLLISGKLSGHNVSGALSEG